MENSDILDNLIINLFHKGFIYKDILSLLQKDHGVCISLSTLKRIIYQLGLRRKYIQECEIEDVCLAIFEELESCGYNLGYRALWAKLRKKYYLQIRRDSVYDLMKLIDPEGLANRYAHRLRRREYVSPGPNFIWHLDGYDKLKPFGFSIHGCIDGFSRYILWLEVSSTNNPELMAHYFLKCVKKQKCVPTVIRSDKGSENVVIESLQVALRKYHEDKLNGERSYIKGRSVHNQRIESYWGQLRKHSADFFINFFKCMVEKNLFDGSELHKNCLRYAFGPLIKKEINLTRLLWNEHRIRKQRTENNVSGVPYILYNLPKRYNAADYGKIIDVETIDELLDEVTRKPCLIDPVFKDAVEQKINFAEANNVKEALDIYSELLQLF